MKLRAISGLRSTLGLQRAALQAGRDDNDSAISATSLSRVARIAPLSRRDTYQKMGVGLSAWKHRLKKPLHRSAPDQVPNLGADTGLATLALADLLPSLGVPTSRRSIPPRKTVMQLRLAFARKPRRPGRSVDKSGLDHDTLPGTDNDHHPEGYKTSDIPAATGPLDATFAAPRSAPTLPYRLLGSTDDASRRQVEKKLVR